MLKTKACQENNSQRPRRYREQQGQRYVCFLVAATAWLFLLPAETTAATTTNSSSTSSTTSSSTSSILWQTNHETGNFFDWNFHNGWQFWNDTLQQVMPEGNSGADQIFGPSVYNSRTPPGNCITSIVAAHELLDQPHSGRYALKMEMTGAVGAAAQGCRTFRNWLRIQGADADPLPSAYYSAWYYLPHDITTNIWWNIFQFKSHSEAFGSEPMLSINVESDGAGNRFLYVYHTKRGNDGSCHCLNNQGNLNGNNCDPSSYDGDTTDRPIRLPLRQWFHVEAYVRLSTIGGAEEPNEPNVGVRNDGAVQVWIDGKLWIDQPDGLCTLLRTDARLTWSINNYADDISPDRIVLLVDDAAIATERVYPLQQQNNDTLFKPSRSPTLDPLTNDPTLTPTASPSRFRTITPSRHPTSGSSASPSSAPSSSQTVNPSSGTSSQVPSSALSATPSLGNPSVESPTLPESAESISSQGPSSHSTIQQPAITNPTKTESITSSAPPTKFQSASLCAGLLLHAALYWLVVCLHVGCTYLRIP